MLDRLSRLIAVASLPLFAAGPAGAQGIVGGRAIDAASANPLSCIEVALVDVRDSIIAQQRVRADGTFEFPAPAKGEYRFAFLMSRHRPLLTSAESMDPSTDSDRTFRLAMLLDTTETAYFDSVAAGLWFREPGQASAKVPRELGSRTSTGYAIGRYAVDVDGRVIAGSVEVLSSTDRFYAQSFSEPLLGTKFITSRFPAREPVCVMIVDAIQWGTAMRVMPEPKARRPGGSILNPRPQP